MLERARKHEKIEFLTDTMVEEVLDVKAKEVAAPEAEQPKDRQGLGLSHQRHVPGNWP